MKPDPATGPPNGIAWRPARMLLSGDASTDGIIHVEGFYRSDDQSVAALIGNCGATPIDYRNGGMLHAGHGFQGGDGTNITVRDVSAWGSHPGVDNAPRGHALTTGNATNVDVQYFSQESAGGIFLENWLGDHSAGQSVKLRNIRSRNVIGSDGTGNDGAGGYRSVIQLKDIHTKGMRIEWIESYNEANKSRIEDTINLFRSGGYDANNLLVGRGFYLHGSYPFPATGDIYTGADLSADGGYNLANGEHPTQWVDFSDVFAVSSGNAAFNIAVGKNITYRKLMAVTSGFLGDGTPMRCSYSGAWVGDFYNTGDVKSNLIDQLTMGFVRTKDARERFDVNYAASVAGSITNVTILPDPITLDTEAGVWSHWMSLVNANNVVTGSRLSR
jgi:hypothetical protein